MKKLAVVGTFVAGAAVGFITCGVTVVRAVISSERCRGAVVDIIADVVSDKVADWINEKERSTNRGYTKEINYATYKEGTGRLYGTRGDAESALMSMQKLVSEYGQVSLQDFYDLSDIRKCRPSFQTIGWKNIDDARVEFTGRGYEIIMPETVALSD